MTWPGHPPQHPRSVAKSRWQASANVLPKYFFKNYMIVRWEVSKKHTMDWQKLGSSVSLTGAPNVENFSGAPRRKVKGAFMVRTYTPRAPPGTKLILFRTLLVSGLGTVSTLGLSAGFLLEESSGLERVRGDLMTLVGTPGGGREEVLAVALPSDSSLFPRNLFLLGKPNDLRDLLIISSSDFK